jgi:16S rRNA (cytosine967-C5)-methyltransferase
MSSRVSAARRAAFDTLWRVESESAYASNLLASNTSDHRVELSREDRALVYELVLGVLRWQGQLDFLIGLYARRPVAKLDPGVRIVLRTGIYQLRFLTRIPAHAAVNESVNLVRERRLKSAAPLVNAVLRAAAREASTDIFCLIASITDPLERLSVETSCPPRLLERWVLRFGAEDARALALASNRTPRTAFRIRPGTEATVNAWLHDNSITTADSALTPGAKVIEAGRLWPDAKPIREGLIYQQDVASQLVARSCVVNRATDQTPARFLDLCAAPGSKTTLVASLLPDNAFIVAADLHHHRLRTLRELASRLGIETLRLVQLDAAQELPFDENIGFDVVLLDAPCSGLGTLARHPEIKWRMTEEKIKLLSGLQRRMIARAARVVRPGGLLVYSVCSTEPEEGENVVADFRARHTEFRDLTRERLVELGIDPSALLTSTLGARTFTHRHGSEGFFFCTLWKRR